MISPGDRPDPSDMPRDRAQYPEPAVPAFPPPPDCPSCDGKGFIEGIGPECCGQNMVNGECRGDCAVAAPFRELCEDCHGTGEESP